MSMQRMRSQPDPPPFPPVSLSLRLTGAARETCWNGKVRLQQQQHWQQHWQQQQQQ